LIRFFDPKSNFLDIQELKTDSFILTCSVDFFQEKLKTALKPLQARLRIIQEFQKTSLQTAEHIKVSIYYGIKL